MSNDRVDRTVDAALLLANGLRDVEYYRNKTLIYAGNPPDELVEELQNAAEEVRNAVHTLVWIIEGES